MSLVLAVLNAAIIYGGPAILGKCCCSIDVDQGESFKSVLLGFAIFNFMAVIFGAMVIRSYQQNAVWSLWMSVLTMVPATISLGGPLANSAAWSRVFRLQQFQSTSEAVLVISTLGLILGNWLGCALIPLDWNRPWQIWPIPNIMLGTAFYLLGALVALIFFHGKFKMIPIVEIQNGRKKTSSTATSSSGKTPVKKSPVKARSKSRGPKNGAVATPRKTVMSAKDNSSKGTSPTRITRRLMKASRSPSRSRTPAKSSKKAPRQYSRSPSPKVLSPRRSNRSAV